MHASEGVSIWDLSRNNNIYVYDPANLSCPPVPPAHEAGEAGEAGRSGNGRPNLQHAPGTMSLEHYHPARTVSHPFYTPAQRAVALSGQGQTHSTRHDTFAPWVRVSSDRHTSGSTAPPHLGSTRYSAKLVEDIASINHGPWGPARAQRELEGLQPVCRPRG